MSFDTVSSLKKENTAFKDQLNLLFEEVTKLNYPFRSTPNCKDGGLPTDHQSTPSFILVAIFFSYF